MNAFNQTLIRELTAVARDFHDDLETRAVVLTGSREAFSAGIDLRDAETWTRPASDVAAREQFYRGVRLCRAWEDMPQITIAAIEGLAVGAGVALAIACDWRVIARDAYLYVPEVRIGLNLQWGASAASREPRRPRAREANHDSLRAHGGEPSGASGGSSRRSRIPDERSTPRASSRGGPPRCLPPPRGW